MEEFHKFMKTSLKLLQSYSEEKENKNVQIYHHNDSDGVTSASILQICFEKLGFKVEKRVALEKPYPPILENIFAQENQIIIFTDICGRIANYLSELNKSKNLVLILDHHVASKPKDDKVLNIDCDIFGIRGDQMSASCVCFAFAQVVLGEEKAQDLSLLGVIGAVGDHLFVDNKLTGQNLATFAVAEKLKLAKWDEKTQQYLNSKNIPLLTIADAIDVLGAIGYFSNGCSTAITYLISDPTTCSITTDTKISKIISDLETRKTEIWKQTFADLDSLTSRKGDISLVNVGDRFHPMGVKMIGIFLQDLILRSPDSKLYYFGSQNVPRTVPGFPDLKLPAGISKISGRVSPKMKGLIDTGRRLALDFLMPNGARNMKKPGFSDACHPAAAAVVVWGGKGGVGEFLECVGEVLEGGKGVGFGYGYGKTILCGGDCGFLMWGVTGIVGALPYETVCCVEPVPESQLTEEIRAKGWVVYDKRPSVPGYKEHKLEKQDLSVKLQMEHFGLIDRLRKRPISITLRGSLLAASGDGASAAHCVSLSRAVNVAFNMGMSEEDVNKGGWIGEHSFHGKPSGVDNTVSTFGGLISISFDRKTSKSQWERINIKSGVEIVLAHSGVTADTSTLLPICEEKRRKDEKKFDLAIDGIKDDCSKMRQAFESANWSNLGKIMCDTHQKIKNMGLSHEIVDKLCKIGLEAGALGAKVTGGGLGGYCLFLTPGIELQKKVKKALHENGGLVIIDVKWPCLPKKEE